MPQKDLSSFTKEHGTADEPLPDSDDDTVPDEKSTTFDPSTCIGFDIAADFAHFRRVGNNTAKPTYHVPPRTTVAGLLAGLMGLPRDSYYDLFGPYNSAIAVVPKQVSHTYTMALTTVNTNEKSIETLPPDRDGRRSDAKKMLTPRSYIEQDRQRDTYQMLVDPVYRIFVALADDDRHTELRQRLENRRFHYSPSLGLSECLAEIRNVGMFEIEDNAVQTVTSAVYDADIVQPEPSVTINYERAPIYMEPTESGRRATYGTMAYTPDESQLKVDPVHIQTVDGQAVVFE